MILRMTCGWVKPSMRHPRDRQSRTIIIGSMAYLLMLRRAPRAVAVAALSSIGVERRAAIINDRPLRAACIVTLPSYAVSYDLSWPGLSRQRRYA
jgi:hypothetical protein